MRKFAATMIMLAVMAVYIFAVVSLSSTVSSWPRLAQLAFYIAAGVAWVIPLKPVMDWMRRGN